MSPARVAVFALALVACGGAVDPSSDVASAAIVSPAVCNVGDQPIVCDDSLPVGYTVQFLDGDGGIAGGCTLAGHVASCRVGDACQVVMAPDGRTVAGECQPAK